MSLPPPSGGMIPMIHWLLQSTTDSPDLAAAHVPPNLLSPTEQARLSGLTRPKRRRDWLLGRWTAKHLLQSVLESETHQPCPLAALSILADPDGAPAVTLKQAETDLPLPLSLSISHSGDYAFCALLLDSGQQVGADIERVEPRSPEFVETYFSNEEQALVQQTPPAQRDIVVTAIWSAKEAALKALRLGLTVDTRSVTCLPALSPTTEWATVTLTCTSPLCIGPSKSSPSLAGWWRLLDGYILTIAVQAP
jgi:4'-phosphopantetheinyl transferase